MHHDFFFWLPHPAKTSQYVFPHKARSHLACLRQQMLLANRCCCFAESYFYHIAYPRTLLWPFVHGFMYSMLLCGQSESASQLMIVAFVTLNTWINRCCVLIFVSASLIVAFITLHSCAFCYDLSAWFLSILC